MLTVNRSGGINVGGDYMVKGTMFDRTPYEALFGAALDHMIETGQLIDTSARKETHAEEDRTPGAEVAIEVEAKQAKADARRVPRSTIGRIEIPPTE